MRTWQAAILASMWIGWTSAASTEPGLPAWQEGERAKLEADGWMPGGVLLSREPITDPSEEAAEKPADVAPPTVEELAENAPAPNEIPEKFWPSYFGARPKCFLLDPQGLLSPVDYRNRLGFLNYHAGDSSIDLFVYVFKGDQDIPGEVREEELVERLFSEGRPAAVVYYFMGAPQRSVLYLSPSLTDVVSAAEQRRALESSVMQAFGNVEAPRQIEAFLVQMSIRIYWMERMMGGGLAAKGETKPEFLMAAKAPAKESAIMDKLRPVLERAKDFTVPVVTTLGAILAALAMNSWLRRRARYFFPEFEVEPRLGGAHAAGVGAVISFASAALPPASQRDQVPDYLRRA